MKRRTNIYLREDQVERLKALGTLKGSSAAELVRQAVDRYLDREEEKLRAKQKGEIRDARE